MGERVARWAAAGFAAVSVAMAVVTPLLARDLQGAPGVRYDVLHTWDVLVPPVYAVTGAALVWLRPRNALGWILVAGGTCGMASTVLGVYGIRAHVLPSAGLPAGGLALSMAAWLWLPGMCLLPTLLPLLYPRGRLPSPRWRLAVVATVAGVAALAIVAVFSREPVQDYVVDARPPLVLPPTAQGVLIATGLSLLAVTSLACLTNAAWRLWRAGSPERAQLAWLLTAATAATLLGFLTPWEWLFALALASVPVAVVIGVLRYGLLGVEIVLRRTLLFGLLTLLVALIFAGVTAGLSALLPPGPLPTFVAAAVVAVGLVPAHTRLRRFVDRLLDGPAADPLTAMGGVGRVLSNTGETGLVPRVLASVADAVGAPHVALRDAWG
jgi:hypothetical protein